METNQKEEFLRVFEQINKVVLFFLCFFFFSISDSYSQNKKPKVVLVLSGGGAKGLAHIPLLQKLDSLKIVPDLVIGNSMGSVVGGLYAMGYSGDSIAQIARKIDWNHLLGGGIALTDVSVEEKSEFGSYLIDLNIAKGKPMVKNALLNDQSLREFLSTLTYPVYKINDFDKLPIPYRAIATDIVNGSEVVLSKGSLNTAMRASMSIPGIFQPVPYENTLLVDGGILNNFPTDVAQKMGADIIIGSDVGGGMAPMEELDNITTILFQTAMLSSNIKNPENQKRCAILVNHIPNLTYSTGDFSRGLQIYEQGKIAVQDQNKELIVLSEKLRKFNQLQPVLPKVKNEFVLDTIVYNNVSRDNLKLLKARTNIKAHEKYSIEQLIQGVNRSMGTNLFSQITWTHFVENDKVGLQFNGFEHSQNQLRSSLHYDTYRGVGLILNYTGRNILGEASRFLVTADIAEQPRFRVQYQKIFGKEKRGWWKSDIYGERLKQSVYIEGELADDIRQNSLQFENQINQNLNSLKSYFGIGAIYQYTNLRPRNNPEVNENIFKLESYYFNNVEVEGHYCFNSLSDVFFPKKGYSFRAKVSRSLLHEVDVTYSDSSIPNVKGSTNAFSRIGFNYDKRLYINREITGIFTATTAFIFEDKIRPDETSFSKYGYAGKFNIGGYLVNPRNYTYTFAGLHEDELNVSQLMKINVGLQTLPFENIYFTPHFNIASVGFNKFDQYIKKAFTPKGEWEQRTETSLLMSGGVTISYSSILGPINFDTSWVNDINKIRVFFSVGFSFNPSGR
ncbi:MAG: patatin-like phospholipase family protein [Flavobacterium sp.]